jgi:hypothetical protein
MIKIIKFTKCQQESLGPELETHVVHGCNRQDQEIHCASDWRNGMHPSDLDTMAMGHGLAPKRDRAPIRGGEVAFCSWMDYG